MPIFVLFGAGAFLGFHLNIIALAPLTAIAAAALTFTTFMDGFGGATHSLLLIWVSVQAGYVVGLTARGLTHHPRSRLKTSQTKQI